jgi:hypothetical protein
LLTGALTEPLQEQIQTAVPDAMTFISGLEWLHGEDATEDETAIGRLLLIDRSTILVSSIYQRRKRNRRSLVRGSGTVSS